MKYFFIALLLSATLAASVEVEVWQGYRRDKLTFTISGPRGRPNILSELSYKDIDVYMTNLSMKVSHNDYFMKLHGAYGDIYNGKVRDSDYLGDNRTLEFSRSKHDITGDYTVDTSVYFGKTYRQKSLRISPMIGFGYYEQKLRMQHGEQQLPLNRKVHNVNSTYQTHWYGPQIGFGLAKKLLQNLNVYGNYVFLYPLTYHANGYWNLRDKHFSDKAKAQKSSGNIVTIGTKYTAYKSLHAGIEYQFMKFYAKDGHCYQNGHRTNLFREAIRTSNTVYLFLGYTF